MFEPIRGGTRGGQAEFKWSDVSADKDRENYLGHSVNAPTGRWQKNKDVHWYNRDNGTKEEEEEEIRKIKEAEAEALAAALGFASGSTPAVKVPPGSLSGPAQPLTTDHTSEKEGRRHKKAERKEEKKARKEKHRKSRHDEYERRQRRTRSRSRSPRPSKHEDHERRSLPHRSRSPSREPHAARHAKSYNEMERERERERDRRRWNLNDRERLSTRYGQG